MMHPELYIEQVRMASMPPSDSYLNDIPAVRWLMAAGELRFDHRVTILVGENGTGKSTLLEAIAVAYGFNPEGGTRNFRFQTEDSHSELWQHIRLGKHRRPRDGFFLRAESCGGSRAGVRTADHRRLRRREPASAVARRELSCRRAASVPGQELIPFGRAGGGAFPHAADDAFGEAA